MQLGQDMIDAIAAQAGLNPAAKSNDGRRNGKSPGRPRKLPHEKKCLPGKKWELTELQALHHQIIRLKLTGMKSVEIAKVLSCTSATVNYTVNSEIGRSQLSQMNGSKDAEAVDFRKEINTLLPKCIRAFDDALDSDDLGLRVKTAQIVAKDFGGKATPTQIDSRHLHMHLSQEQIESVKSRGIENAKMLLDKDIVISPEESLP